jgi:hypothetical protein
VITATFCSAPIVKLLYFSEAFVVDGPIGCVVPIGLNLCFVDAGVNIRRSADTLPVRG